MAEQRQSSRFRLPSWLQRPRSSSEKPTARRRGAGQTQQAPPSPSPESQLSPPPTDPPLTERTQSRRSQPTPKPVSLPSRASAKPQDASPPPESQLSPPGPPPTERTQSRRSQRTPKPASLPSRASAKPQDASQDTSPFHVEEESPSATQPPSPSHAATQTKAEAQQPSQADQQTQSPPPSLASHPSVQTSPVPPPSQSLTGTRAQSAPGGVTQPLLPSENVQPMTHPLPFTPSTLPISSVPEEEPKPDRPEPESQELQPNNMPAQYSEASEHVTEPPQTSTTAEDLPVLTQKSDSSVVSSATKSLPGSDAHPGQDIEGKEILQEDRSKEKILGVTEILDAAPGSEVATQIHPSVASDAEQKQLEKEKISGKKETTSQSSSHRKEDQTVMVISKNKATVSESFHEPNISKVEKAPQQKNIREDISKFLHGMATDQQKLPLGEGPAAVVTLAGENRGASMHLGSESAKRDGTVHIHRGYKINPDESSTDGEMTSEETGSQDSQTGEDQEPKAYINSNVQSVNNSIICNSSVNERDPGVQLAFTQDLTEPYEPKRTRSMKSPETHEAEVIVTTAKKLTYEPTVRRRCLRGLFLEPSDSDSDNPEKPRRHGCRYACKGKSKDNETDVL